MRFVPTLLALSLLTPAAAFADEPPDPDPEAGDTGAATEAEAPSDATGAAPGEPELTGIYPDREYIDAVRASVSQKSLGYALGRHGDGFVLGLRWDQPITDSFFLRIFHYTNFGDFSAPFDPTLVLGINTMFRSDPIMGIFRLYGGGGFYVGFRPSPDCHNPYDPSDDGLIIATDGGRDETVITPEGQKVQRVQDGDRNDPNSGFARAVADRVQRCEDQKDAFGISGGGYSGIEFFNGPMRAFFIEIGGMGGIQKSGRWSDSGLIIRAGNQFYF